LDLPRREHGTVGVVVLVNGKIEYRHDPVSDGLVKKPSNSQMAAMDGLANDGV
jgi:hypothetical protein